jgi:hypothetical protein
MPAQKFLARESGKTKQKKAIQQSTGAADAGKIPALDSSGRFDESLMPLGIGAQVDILPASEALDAGDYVNIFSDSGVAKVRKADNSNGRPADGFVSEAVASSADATVYPLDGVNAAMSALTPGAEYWLGTAGDVIATPLDETDPLNENKISQQIGKALSATELRTDDYGYVIL